MNCARLLGWLSVGALSTSVISSGQATSFATGLQSLVAAEQLRQVSLGAGAAAWATNPHIVLDTTDALCGTDRTSSCTLRIELHGHEAAYRVITPVQSIRLKQTSAGITRSNGRDAPKALAGQAASSLPDYFPLPRLLKTLVDPSLKLSVSANDGKTITVTAETADERRRKSDPLDFLNTRRFLIDKDTGELRAIEFTIASAGNARLNRPAKVSYLDYKKTASGISYAEEIRVEIDGHLMHDYHVTQINTTTTTFSEQ